MGGRPRKPTAVLELNGAFKHDPDRKRTDEPRPTGKPGKAPEYLGEDGAALWDEMVAEGFWLTSADAFLLEVAVHYLDNFRKGTTDPKLVSPLINVLNKLGFGPAERSKIKAPGAKPDETEDPFDKFK
jgi:phage terminase small subunit